MTVPFSNTKLRVPQGFRSVLEVVSREVMRDEPAEALTFIKDLFQKLLNIRDETGHDPAQHGAHAEDRFYNNWSFSESVAKAAARQEPTPQPDMEHSEPEVAEQCTKTSANQVEEDIDIDLNDPAMEDAAVKIQAQFKGFMVRKSMHQ